MALSVGYYFYKGGEIMSITKSNAYTLIDECNGDFNKAIKLAHKKYRKGIYTRSEWVNITEAIITEREVNNL